MNKINKYSVESLGYNFIEEQYLPPGKDEYWLRFQQNPATDYRPLTRDEITILKANGNNAGDWSKILVRDGIDIQLIEASTFYGLVRIGKLEPYYLEFSEMRKPVGISRSFIVSCDIGNNVSINNVRFLSHYIIEDEVILANINEMSCTSHSKFGNGVVKDGEPEDVRIWLELCNENGGRKVLPFDGMLPGDAWLWSKYRGDQELMDSFKAFTEKDFDAVRGYYGIVGKRTVIKNTDIIKDVKIGSDAYIKGANKLKNLTINSAPDAQAQIGEGCEMVNGIIGYGSRSFYGVKAVRFILAPFSQLKYGARLINSYLGENATISCCEVLNSLIFPAHEQHHNNSFLCASLLMGQTNMAAGATIGSNHNSRGADGEIVAGRGFWPGLCVSLKHNSKFASFTMIAKGDFPAELNIPLPFSLLSNDVHDDSLVVMPAYWLLYNMYAIIRNERKFAARDKRNIKMQLIEYDFLAPDTINEIFDALQLLEQCTGKAFYEAHTLTGTQQDHIEKGKALLMEHSPAIASLQVVAEGFENSKRPVRIIKVQQAYDIYKTMIRYYAATRLLDFLRSENIRSTEALRQLLPHDASRNTWTNVGGQLIVTQQLKVMLEDIKQKRITDWEGIHQFYKDAAATYQMDKLAHSLACLQESEGKAIDCTQTWLQELLEESVLTKTWIVDNIYNSKAKDYKNPFRNMVYDSTEEMESVLGKLEDNSFINEQKEELEAYKQQVAETLNRLNK